MRSRTCLTALVALAIVKILLVPEESRYVTVEVSERLGTWDVLEPFVTATKIINVPTAKHHDLTGVSCGLKNWFGVTARNRIMLHADVQRSIACIRPKYAIPHSTGLSAREIVRFVVRDNVVAVGLLASRDGERDVERHVVAARLGLPELEREPRRGERAGRRHARRHERHQLPGHHDRPVGEDDAGAADVVDREPVLQAVRAAGILGDVAADRAGDLRRRVRRVEQSVRAGRFRDRQVRDPGLHSCQAPARIERRQVVERRRAGDQLGRPDVERELIEDEEIVGLRGQDLATRLDRVVLNDVAVSLHCCVHLFANKCFEGFAPTLNRVPVEREIKRLESEAIDRRKERGAGLGGRGQARRR